MRCLKFSALALASIFLSNTAFAQEPASALGDSASSAQSLGDLARKMRKSPTAEVKMTEEDTKKLFDAVDRVLTFASQDSGFPKRSTVKRRLISSADVEQYTKERLAKADTQQSLAHAELAMKKIGFLPRDFKLGEFLVKANGQEVAGYYDDETKTISMLNWISLEKQGPILAHELTHALQDQNYDLQRWAFRLKSVKEKEHPSDEVLAARHAVIEGQAMVVYIDFLLAPMGRTLENTPGLVFQMEDTAVKAVIDSEMMHAAPIILRESGTFPYREGLIFEGELLAKGGKVMAFSGAFARPPRTTHEIMDPRAYMEGEKLPSTTIPDVHQVLSGKYEVYDSGEIGELEVRALVRQYGKRSAADDLAAAWRGGAYSVFRKSEAPQSTLTPATNDLALLYVSRWKSPQSAESFARFYVSAVSQRYKSVTAEPLDACNGACPVSKAQLNTEEGPVIIEQWPGNLVLISESFDKTTAASLTDAIRQAQPNQPAGETRGELSQRLFEIPAFRAFSQRIGEAIRQQLALENGSPLENRSK